MNAVASRRSGSSNLRKDLVRPIAVAFIFVSPGFLLRPVLNLALDVEISVLFASVLNFGLAAIGAFVVFPKGIKQPFGEVSLAEYSRRSGFYLPTKAWKHIALGAVLALCTLEPVQHLLS